MGNDFADGRYSDPDKPFVISPVEVVFGEVVDGVNDQGKISVHRSEVNTYIPYH